MLESEIERCPVRCQKCSNRLAIRDGNVISAILKHRDRKKEIRIRLEAGQEMTIICERCGCENQIIGN